MHPDFARRSGLPLVFADGPGNMRLIFDDASADRILILAVLHHFNEEQRRSIYAECLRVLKPGGKMVVADVVASSPQAEWLNGFVDQYSSTGHKGVFFSEEDATPMREAGFEDVHISTSNHEWSFESKEQRAAFLKGLFDLKKVDDIEMIIDDSIATTFGSSSISIPWSLMFFVASKKEGAVHS